MDELEHRLAACEERLERMHGNLTAAHFALAFTLAQRPNDETLIPFCNDLIEFMSQQIQYAEPKPSQTFVDAYSNFANTLARLAHIECRSPTKAKR